MFNKSNLLVLALFFGGILTFYGCNATELAGGGNKVSSSSSPTKDGANEPSYEDSAAPKAPLTQSNLLFCEGNESESVEKFNATGTNLVVSYDLKKSSIVNLTGTDGDIKLNAIGSASAPYVNTVCVNITSTDPKITYKSVVNTNNLMMNITATDAIINIEVPAGIKIGRLLLKAVSTDPIITISGEGEFDCSMVTIVGTDPTFKCGK